MVAYGICGLSFILHSGYLPFSMTLDTEIQTENRELVALPNTYMITNPTSVTRSSGTIVSTTLSLGFDVHHSKVESLLLDSAQRSGLEEPFI